FFFFQAEDGIRDLTVTGVQTCALPLDVFAVTGVESVSRVGRGVELSELNPRLDPNAPGDKVGEVFTPMGVTAENVADDFGITREEMDAFAQRSQERAVAAREAGITAREIEPYTLPDGRVF